ncbi:MAG TPA: PfkB family carbohydrate kinase [Gaiellaceae bacterium]|nr:PfkB family carbohydrate kinase [Gaiellaceae bacterium]
MRLAVVGHVEWVEFLRVPHLPAAGEIVHTSDAWAEPAGGGAVAAVQLAKLAGSADFFTALGDDELGRRAHEELSALGLRLHVAWRDEPQRRAETFVDDAGERTITVIGDRLVPRGSDPLPWGELGKADGVYFTGGDVAALRAARAARILTATPRTLDTLRAAHIELDALVGSGRDPGERVEPGELDPPPKLRVATLGAEGGVLEPGGPFSAAPLPGPLVDTYGAGDSFAAGLTYGLAAGMAVREAVALASRCGAAALTGRGAFAGQLETIA